MSPKLFEDITKFVLDNKGDSAFIYQNDVDIRENLLEHAMESKLEYALDEQENLSGVCLWKIKEFIPMEIEIEECISLHPHAIVSMLRCISDMMPPLFSCTALRHKASVLVEYKNPRRILRLIERLSYGSRSKCTETK